MGAVVVLVYCDMKRIIAYVIFVTVIIEMI